MPWGGSFYLIYKHQPVTPVRHGLYWESVMGKAVEYLSLKPLPSSREETRCMQLWLLCATSYETGERALLSYLTFHVMEKKAQCLMSSNT